MSQNMTINLLKIFIGKLDMYANLKYQNEAPTDLAEDETNEEKKKELMEVIRN